MCKLALAMLSLVALAGFAFTQFVLGCMGLAQLLGVAGAVLGVLLWPLLGLRLPLQIGMFVGALSLWHWPWFAALLFAAPRELLMVPGLAARLIARLRHPPPSWQGTASAAAHRAAARPG